MISIELSDIGDCTYRKSRPAMILIMMLRAPPLNPKYGFIMAGVEEPVVYNQRAREDGPIRESTSPVARPGQWTKSGEGENGG